MKPGGYVLVRLTFANADPVTVKVPVVVDEGPYASITPKPSPSGVVVRVAPRSPSPSASPSGSATP